MRLYIRREDQVDFQSTWFFVYIGINSDGSAWFLICTSLKSQQDDEWKVSTLAWADAPQY